MALSGVHQIVVRVVINKDHVASDMTVHNVWIHAVNSVSSSITFRPENCPDQDAVDRVKRNIVHRHVTGNRIFVDDNTYNNLMDPTERHDVFQIRYDLRANKDPMGRNNRKRTSEVAALQRSVRDISARVDNFPDNRSEDDRERGQ